MSTQRGVAVCAARRGCCACQGLAALQCAGWVRLLHRFELRDAYACTPELRRLANDVPARERLTEAVRARAGGEPPPPPPSWADVLRLYAAFRPEGSGGWRTVRAVAELHPRLAARVDLRVLVYAGQLNGLLRHVDLSWA